MALAKKIFRVAIGWAYCIGLYRYYIHSRTHLPLILNAMNLKGVGAEVGVEKGQFSEHILLHWNGTRLYSIDPWKAFSREEYRDASNVDSEEQDRRFRDVKKCLGRFGEKSVIMRETSSEASRKIGAGQLDFVYIDAQHHYEAVMEDLQLWYPKIRLGGVLAGHDYVNGVLSQGVFGVKQAVDEFAAERKFQVNVSRGKYEKHPSWFLFLPEAKDDM